MQSNVKAQRNTQKPHKPFYPSSPNVLCVKFTVLPSTWLSSPPLELVSQQGTGLCPGPQPARGSACEVSLDVCALLWLCGWEPPSPQGTLGSA